MTTTPLPARPLWCVRCEHPAPYGVCPLCRCPETTTVRPEDGWGGPDDTTSRRHGTELYDDLAFEVLIDDQAEPEHLEER